MDERICLHTCSIGNLKSRWYNIWKEDLERVYEDWMLRKEKETGERPSRPLYHPYYEEIKTESEEWVKQFRYFAKREREETNTKLGDFTKMACYVHPTASRDLLRILSDYYHLIFAHDDQIDYMDECGCDFQKCLALHNGLQGIFGFGYKNTNNDIFAMYSDVWKRLKCRTTEMQQHLFIEYTMDYSKGQVEQAHVSLDEPNYQEFNPKRNELWTMEEFRVHKRKVCGANIPFWFSELIVGHPLPVSFLGHPLYSKLINSCTDTTWIGNDIYSAAKELHGGIEDHDNVISVLHQVNPNLSAQSLIDTTCDMLETEELQFERLEKEAASFDWPEKEKIMRIIRTAKHFSPGMIEWSKNNPRYDPNTYVNF